MRSRMSAGSYEMIVRDERAKRRSVKRIGEFLSTSEKFRKSLAIMSARFSADREYLCKLGDVESRGKKQREREEERVIPTVEVHY